MSVALLGAQPVSGDAGSGAIYFFPDGSSSGGEIDFAAGQARVAVTIDWFTGRVALR